MTPLDDETQRILAIYDAWLACKCGEYERWAEDGAGRCKHERALHYVAEEACEHIRALSERLARVEAEAALGRLAREHIYETNFGWQCRAFQIDGAPSLESLDEAIRAEKSWNTCGTSTSGFSTGTNSRLRCS